MGAIFRREMSSFFASPVAYVFLAVFYLFAGFNVYLYATQYGTADLSYSFSAVFIILLLLIPLITMKLFSEEIKQKTDQALLTAPVSLTAIVYGKFFAALILLIIAVCVFFVYALIFSLMGATIAWSVVLGSSVGLILVGSTFIAANIFISSLTENQVIAAVGGFIVNLIFYLLDTLGSLINIDFISKILLHLSFYEKYYECTRGIFNLSSILFYVSVVAIFNFLTVRVLEKKRWS